MKIGELAVATATQIETIRFYEREGLIPTPGRSTGNYRVYEASHVQRLIFIRRCRGLDMALDEIRTLLRFTDGRFVPADRLLRGFPCWILFTFKHNHRPTDQLTDKQKTKAWKNGTKDICPEAKDWPAI